MYQNFIHFHDERRVCQAVFPPALCYGEEPKGDACCDCGVFIEYDVASNSKYSFQKNLGLLVLTEQPYNYNIIT